MSKLGVNEAAQYFEGIFTTAHEGIVLVDHEGIILKVNPPFTKILGYEEKEILGKPFYILNFKDQVMKKGSSHSPLYRFYSSEKASMEYGFFDKQGRDVTIRFRSFIMRDEYGQAKEAIGILEHMVELTGTDKAGSSLAEKMWEAQQNFDNILENSADAVVICDNSGNITMANKAFLKMLNYTKEEVIGKFIVEFTAVVEGTYATTTGEEIIIDEESVNNTGSRSAGLFEKGYIKNWETYFVRKDKVHVPVDATLSVLKDKDGERRGSIVILRDSTERKRAEQKIKEARDYLENIIKTSLDGIMVTGTPKGEITMVNRALEMMLGYSEGELIGRTGASFTPDDEKCKKKGMEFVTKLFEEGFVNGSENLWQRKDGSLIDVERNAALLKDGEGNTIGAVASVRDITNRKKIGKALQLSEERYRSLIENANDAIISTSKDGRIIGFNKKAEEMLGYTCKEILGKPITLITDPSTKEK